MLKVRDYVIGGGFADTGMRGVKNRNRNRVRLAQLYIQ
jgi:hypothetical protein